MFFDYDFTTFILLRFYILLKTSEINAISDHKHEMVDL